MTSNCSTRYPSGFQPPILPSLLSYARTLVTLVLVTHTMGLLKNLDPLLTADVLHILRSMGHGDKLLICDCNFPAAEVSTKTTTKKHVIITTSLPPVIDAICSVLPLDYFVEDRVQYMIPDAGLELPPSGVDVKVRRSDEVGIR